MKVIGHAIGIFFRYGILLLIFILPFAAAGFLIYSKIGFFVGVGFGYLVFLWMLMRSEDGIALAYRALEIKHVGFQRTLDRVIFELGDDWDSRPRLLIFPDPAPALLVFRRPGTNGTVLISQGMVPLLNETELRCLVQYAVKRCRDQGITLSTFCSYLSVLIFKWAPIGWARLMFTEGRIALPNSDTNLGVFTAFRFSYLFLLRFNKPHSSFK